MSLPLNSGFLVPLLLRAEFTTVIFTEAIPALKQGGKKESIDNLHTWDCVVYS